MAKSAKYYKLVIENFPKTAADSVIATLCGCMGFAYKHFRRESNQGKGITSFGLQFNENVTKKHLREILDDTFGDLNLEYLHKKVCGQMLDGREKKITYQLSILERRVY